MALTLLQTKTAMGPGLTASLLGVGGTGAVSYSVRPDGAGGTINATTGIYTAPTTLSTDPKDLYDTIVATDSLGATATAKIFVGTPLHLFCEVLQKELGLADGRVYLWDQKIMQPSDNDLYVAVGVQSCKPFGNSIAPDPTTGWANAIQSVNMMATLDIDIISRGPAARDRKEEVILALNSLYAQAQQEANSFYIGKLSPGARFLNLSVVDGAAIPYRYKISVNMQYTVKKTKAVDYFDTFQTVSVATNP